MNRISKIRNQILNIFFLLRRPKTVIVLGKDKENVLRMTSEILKQSKLKQGIYFAQYDILNKDQLQQIEFWLKNSSFAVLVVTSIEQDEEEKCLKGILKNLPERVCLLLDKDGNIEARAIKESKEKNVLTFGLQEGADIFATDIKIENGINFKVNYKGNSVPFWLEGSMSQEKLSSVLAVIACSLLFGLNLVEISRALKQ
jgi:hypothetical protein